jgi:polyhydroxybutyrate depolymerase
LKLAGRGPPSEIGWRLRVKRLVRVGISAVLFAWWVARDSPVAAQDLEAQPQVVLVGGSERMYLVHVPPALARPAPVVLVFHGGGGRAEAIMRNTGMNEVADRQHFIAVYPEGSGTAGRGRTWNVGVSWDRSSADDVAFVRAILQSLERSFAIDRRRVYATGLSMGGMLTYRLACEMSDTFAAIAPVSATMIEPDCRPHSPVAVFHVHGTADENVPFNGGAGRLTGPGRSWPPAARSIEFWAQFDHCGPPPAGAVDGPETTCYAYAGCRATVELCLVRGSGHGWPGGAPKPWQQLLGNYVSPTFPTSARIWEFFAAHPKP